MESDDLPLDPFEDMSPEERKHFLERKILEAAYDVDALFEVEQRERPDFAIRVAQHLKPVGVEITQVFQDESHARLNMMSGYMSSLWEGGRFRHKEDAKRLKVDELTVTDRRGITNPKKIVAIISEVASGEDLRAALSEAIRAKVSRNYASDGFSHLNLIILDWFNLEFNSSSFKSSQFLDSKMRETLKSCPFREIQFLVYDTTRTEGDTSPHVVPKLKRVRLQLLLLVERFQLAAQAIDQSSYAPQIKNLDQFGHLIAEYLSRVEKLGQPVKMNGSIGIAYGGAVIGLSPDGDTRIFDFMDNPIESESFEPSEILPDEVLAEIYEFQASNIFHTSMAEDVFSSYF